MTSPSRSDRMAPPPGGVTLVKLGGSLITDKRRPGAARLEVIERLAGEVARAAPRLSGRLVVGHGAGSFGHAPAARWQLAGGLVGRGGPASAQLAGVTATQDEVAKLHRMVIAALRAEGAPAFSLAPSSFLVTVGGRPVAMQLEPLLGALAAGLLPVIYGDVTVDRRQGVAIASTETVFRALAGALLRRGRAAERALWLGETAGILDAAGLLIPLVTPGRARAARRAVGAAAGTDVTGGMRHRLDAALALARRGVPSLIADGRVPGLLERALAGEAVPGTVVSAG